ncbi:MAG: DUF167 domain-containing protein [Coriobacteriales bacterium]|nr:DUF167 domain-containing protein [Coriobacteriales bacterium]
MSQTLRIKVTPRASSNTIVGWCGEAHDELALKVTAPAEGGKANTAVIKLLARTLNIPKTAITIVRGDTARHKLVVLDTDSEVFEAWIASLSEL